METSLDKALSGMILSASGWRGIFAANGDEESFSPEITLDHALIAACAALAFSSYLRDAKIEGSIIIGRDTRPTGRVICGAMIRTLVKEGWDIKYTAAISAPEIMAYARSSGEGHTAGFVYVSASHNPIGHNGLKFGLTNGGVLGGSEAAILIDKFKTFINNKECTEQLGNWLEAWLPASLEITSELSTGFSDDSVMCKIEENKADAKKAYTEFTREVISGLAKGDEVFNLLKQGLVERPLGIVADFNGSARTVSIDREFLSGLGIKVKSINDEPGQIAHAIVPEGKSLEPCKEFLESCHREDTSFILGYVPDCDGDRGNLVIWDESQNCARVLEAQEVFVLACVAELSYLVWTGELKYDSSGKALTRTALAVNDPTSLRIDSIARAFGIPVFRAEVGEANVVELARKLRQDGYQVRILGEGSNGGNITHPAAVRDPLNTLGALIKLLCLRSKNDRKGLFEIWCNLSSASGRELTFKNDFTLADVIASLPAYTTTPISAEEAILKVSALDHSLLKDNFQKVFLRDWEQRKDELKEKYGISGWAACAYNGIEEKNITRFGEAGQGGLKISFLNDEGQNIACVWMRGSRTEPVFRIMADAEGTDKQFERDLIDWQRKMTAEADSISS